MIPRTRSASHTPSWQKALACAVTDPAELLRLLQLDPALLPGAQRAARLFPLRAPRGYVARMRRGDPSDPLLRQVLPLDDECVAASGFVTDPVGDLAAMIVPGVLRKYRGRALLVTTGACAVHCRYCFRRHFPYGEAHAAKEGWRAAIQYLLAEPSVTEVILSGGDPLTLSDRKLAELCAMLAEIKHIQRLRVHTRLPIVLPERVDDTLLRTLTSTRLQTVMVVHANHANELDDAVGEALASLRHAGIILLNQTVLLRGVNDQSDTLADLSEALFAAGVLPYYLHLLDPVQGAAHFDVPEATGRALMANLCARLPGYLVPRLVREEEGEPGKLLLAP
jgi:lysine-2,3-aminomutase-related protein